MYSNFMKIVNKFFNTICNQYFEIKIYPNYGYFYILYIKLLGYIKFFIEIVFPLKKSLLPLDVIITVAPKDINKLENCLIGVKKNILHTISNIFIIGKKDPKLEQIEKNFSCVHVEEDYLINKNSLGIKYILKGIDRSGWLFQQLLKYKAVIILGNEKFKLIIDADTVFCRKQKFEKNNKIIFNASNSYHLTYFDAAKNLLDLKKVTNVSFVSHHIIYNKEYLSEMLNYLEKKYDKVWYRAIIENIDYDCMSNFSEFESYAQFVMSKYKHTTKVEYWFNKTIFRENKKYIPNIFDCFFYKSLSFHSWAVDD
jgi:hypothetical protein